MTSIRKSLAILFATRYTEVGIQFLTTIVIARLLTPREIGIFSVSVVLISLAHAVRAFGVGQYIVQEQNLTPDRLRSAFGISLLIAWSVAVLIALISHAAAQFYRQPGVQNVLLVLAVNFILIPFGSVTMAYMRRQMQFAILYKVKTISTLVSSVAVIVLALLGYGYMSMAWSAVVGVITSIIAVAFYRPRDMPYMPRFKEFGRILKFGSYMSASTIMRELGTGAPELVIGRALSMDAVGLFGRAIGLVQIFNRAITSAVLPAVLPHFSAKHREGQPVKDAYLRAMAYLSGLAWPFFAFLGVMAYPAVRILYGPQWDASIPLVRILCLEGALFVGIVASTEVFVAIGHVSISMKFQVLYQTLKFAAIIAAVPFGLSAVAVAMVVSSLIGLLVVYKYMESLATVSFRDFVSATFKSVMVTGVSAAVPLFVSLTFDIGPKSLLPPFALASTGFIAGWLFAILLMRHPIRDELSAGWLHIRNVIT